MNLYIYIYIFVRNIKARINLQNEIPLSQKAVY